MIQVNPGGRLTLRPGRNPPVISIFSTSHIFSASAGVKQAGCPPYRAFRWKAEPSDYPNVQQRVRSACAGRSPSTGKAILYTGARKMEDRSRHTPLNEDYLRAHTVG